MWSELYEAHEAARALGSHDVANQLRARIKELVKRRHCDGRFTGKLDYKKNGARGKKEIWVKGAMERWAIESPSRVSQTSLLRG